MLFNTIYYNLRLKIKNTPTSYSRENLRLDYEDKDFIKYEKIREIFKEELGNDKREFELFIDFSIPNSKLVIERIGDYLVIATKELYLRELDIEYSLKQSSDFISIAIPPVDSNIYSYKLSVLDNGNTYEYSFLENTKHRFNSREITITIDRLYNGYTVKSITRDIVLNLTGWNEEGLDNDVIISTDATGKENFFTTGREYRNVNPTYIKEKNYDEFDISIDILKDSVSVGDIYPKVTGNYSKKCTYDYTDYDVDGYVKYNASISGSSSAKFYLKKCVAGTISTTIEVSGFVKYIENNTYKTKEVKSRYSASVNLNDFLRLEKKVATIDIKRATSSLNNALSKSVRVSLLEGTTGTDKELYSLSIKTIETKIDNVATPKTIIVPYFYKASNGKIDFGRGIGVIISPMLGVYEGDAIFSRSCDGENVLVITDSDVDSISMKDQDGKAYSGKAVYKYYLCCLANTNGSNFSIDGKKAYMSSTKDVVAIGEIKLNKVNPAISVDLKEHILPYNLGENYSATVVFEVIESCIINGVLKNKGTSFSTVMTLRDTGFVIGFVGRKFEITLTESISDDNNGDGYPVSCNGNEGEYLLESKGKETVEYTTKPLHVPSFARNIRHSLELRGIVPNEASAISVGAVNGDCSVLTFSSEYVRELKTPTVDYEKRHTYKGYGMYKGAKREVTLSIYSDITKECYIHASSSNSSMLIEAPLKVSLVAGETVLITVIVTNVVTRTSPTDIEIDPVYFYERGHEYFMYKDSVRVIPSGNTAYLPMPKTNLNPMCVRAGTDNLKRVISNCSDGISIKETFYSENIIYTKYKDIIDTQVFINGKRETREIGKNYIITLCKSGDTVDVYYKVANSFDYIVENGKTVITTSNKYKELDVFMSNEKISLGVDLNPVNNIYSDGYVCIGDNSSRIAKATLRSFEVYSENYLHYIEIFDENMNPYIGEIVVNIDGEIATDVSKYGYYTFKSIAPVTKISIGVKSDKECEVHA